MKEKFIKKYWSEDDVMFYIHFTNGIATRQVEISKNNKVYLTQNNPVVNESMLYDQNMEDLELNLNDFITKEEFEKIWKF